MLPFTDTILSERDLLMMAIGFTVARGGLISLADNVHTDLMATVREVENQTLSLSTEGMNS